MSVGSQTTHAMTRANHAGAMDAKRKLQEIAARDLGGAPDDYELGDERVYRKGQPGRGAHLRAGRHAGHRARRQVRRPRAARRHPRGDQGRGGAAGRARPDGRGQGHLSARRRDLRVRRRLCRSGGGRRDRRRHARGLPERRRRRRRDQPAQPHRAAERRRLPGHRARALPAPGLRPALRPVAGAPVLQQPAADDPRRAAHHARGRRWAFPIRRRRSAPRAWASRRWAPATARC